MTKPTRRQMLGLMTATMSAPALLAKAKAPVPGQIQLPHGFALKPPKDMEVTFQIIEAYDEKEKVLAVWSGDNLHYFIALLRMPAGWTDAEDYFKNLRRDISAEAGVAVPAGRISRYQAQGRLRGQCMELDIPSQNGGPAHKQLVHFLTDGAVSFVGIAQLLQPGQAEKMLSSSVQLFKTATLLESGAQPESESSPYVGLWSTQALLPDGRTALVEWRLKPDLTFATTYAVGDSIYWMATGTWDVHQNVLSSTYLYSKPELPAHSKVDTDDIQAFDGKTLTLRSRRNGRVVTFVRKGP